MLPPDVTFFTGRDAELSRLDALLKAGAEAQPAAVVISAIAGSPGVGKTALALRWAHRVHAQFPDGQLYVNLCGHDLGAPVSPEQALDGFLRALNVSGENVPHTVDAMAGYFRSLVAGRRILVMLDNAATAEQVRPLLPASPTCMVLITSRSRLSGLVARNGAYRITLDLLAPAEAITLLRTIIGAIRADNEPEATNELARRCAYLPLALRIAAERVAARPHVRIANLVDDLSTEQNRLDVLATDDDETTAIRTVFSWSYRSLTRPAASVFRLLSIHPGPNISVPVAATLTNTTPVAVRRLLDTLASVNLLTETDHDRYHFHDLIRAYAGESARAEEPASARTAAERRLLNWYLHTAIAARQALYPQIRPVPVDALPDDCQPLSFEDRADAVRWYDLEHDNLLSAMRRAVDSGHDSIGWHLPAALSPFLSLRSRWADKIAVLQTGLIAARRAADRVGEFWSLLDLGEAHFLQLKQFDAAIPHLQRALEIAQESSDVWGQGQAVVDLGIIALDLKEFGKAIAHFRRGIDLLRRVNDERGQALCLVHLASALRQQGKLPEAIDHAHRGLAIFQRTNNRWNEAFALAAIGSTYLAYQQFDQAIEYLQKAATAYQEVDDQHGIAETITYLGEAFLRGGHVGQARTSWSEALRIFDNLKSPFASGVRACLEALEEADIHRQNRCDTS